eukprot:32135-Rhodomonas_salina.1
MEMTRRCEKLCHCKALANWGLQIVKVGSDGNCLFRSFAEAHCGDQEMHHTYRHREIYENFIHIDDTASKSSFEDGEDAWKNFEEYIAAMSEVNFLLMSCPLLALSLSLSSFPFVPASLLLFIQSSPHQPTLLLLLLSLSLPLSNAYHSASSVMYADAMSGHDAVCGPMRRTEPGARRLS